MKEIHIKEGPFIKSANKVQNMMKNLLISLIPIVLFSFYKNGYLPFKHGKTDIIGLIYPLIFILVSVFTSCLTEYFYNVLIKKEKKSFKSNLLFSVFPGLFLALTLPINTPIWLLIIGAFIASIFGKMIWGGLGNNKLNPALVGNLFVILMLLLMGNVNYLNSYESTIIADANSLVNPATLNVIGTYETLVAPYGSLWNFLIGTVPGALGTTSVLFCIIAYFYLTYKKALKWRIPLVYIGTVFIITYFIGFLNGVGLWYPTFQILSGGLMFMAIFMATDPVTSPTTPTAQVVYGMSLGILTVLFRYIIPVSNGIVISILIMNGLTILLDKIGAQARFDFKKISILILVEMVLALAVSIYIAEVKNNLSVPNQESNLLQE